MSQPLSRIPHLARAIAEKRKLRSRFDQFTNQRYEVSIKVPYRTRSFSSSQLVSQQRAPPATASSSSTYTPKNAGQPFRRLPSHGIPYPSDEESKDNAFRDSVYRYGTLTFFALAGAYIFFAYQSYRVSVQKYKERPEHLKLKQNADVSDRWKDTTRNFDHEVESQERVLLMSWKRKRLIREAYGDVLEVSVGTGRNMELYDTRPYSAIENSSYGRSRRHMITSLTFNDQSEVMVENAKRKWELRQSQRRKDDRFTGDVSFVVGDAGQAGVIERPPGGYDTIVQSMGVCSMADPVGFLRHLGRLVRQPGEQILNSSPEKFRKQENDGKGGRIFLLEHGRGYGWLRWLNSYLDNTAPMHAERYGCWYNKDIGDIVKESGLVVERVKRYSFGTVWEVILRPAPTPLPGEDQNIIQAVQGIKDLKSEESGEQKGWLSSWWK
ncbi:hypothetical protein PMZ80_007545 [Knufia obscura]|uniref:Uncharacterized protein n=2 Tax=Knufia TaxID=430999 RepID=A0AAN8EM93_9EURO|nr:hypothetical protein PMZ80_007545 [Knufia obscura]KAK5954087.1 hypothetical protein OHC33_004658 [Knufia fluminis]